MADVVLGRAWGGLNRQVAPHLLPERESPDCENCDTYQDQEGLLGPRAGRRKVYNRDYEILSVGSCLFPWGRFRMIATADGVWHPEELTFPELDAIAIQGSDTVDVNLNVTQTGAGTTNGTSAALETPLDLANYTRMTLDMSVYAWGLTVSESGGFVDGNVTLQGKIDGVWTDLWRWTLSAGVVESQLLTFPTTGSLTDVRLQGTSDTAGDVTGNLIARLCFARQNDNSGQTAA